MKKLVAILLLVSFLFFSFGCVSSSSSRSRRSNSKGSSGGNDVNIGSEFPRHYPSVISGLNSQDALNRLSSLMTVDSSEISFDPYRFSFQENTDKDGPDAVVRFNELFRSSQVILLGGNITESGSDKYLNSIVSQEIANNTKSKLISGSTGSMTNFLFLFSEGVKVTGNTKAEALDNARQAADILYTIYRNGLNSQQQSNNSSSQSSGGIESRLEKLKTLKEKGIITESEYQAKRKAMIEEL